METKKMTKTKAVQTKETTTMTGAEAVVRSLLAEKVDTIFGYPGGAIMPVYDALYDYLGTINHILTRHEQGSIHAAQGYARVSGRPGVVFSTSGPGATNLITGLADAMIDSTPLVCITGQVPAHLLGTDAFQETDVMGISMPITKWNYQITQADEIAEVIAKAFYVAQSGRPGPVVIDITKDAQIQQTDFHYEKCTAVRSYTPRPQVDQEKIAQAAILINQAKKPLVVVGQGIILSGAEKELLDFVEKTGVPVASTLLGLGAIPNNHPQYAGFVGMHGNYAPNIKTNECDVLVGIGMRFDDRVTGNVASYAKQAKIIHIDIDRAEIGKIVKTDVALHADAKDALASLNKQVSENTHTEWLSEFHQLEKIEKETLAESHKDFHEDDLKMDEVVALISEKTKGDAIIVTDVGQHQMMAARYYRFNNTRSNVTSGGLGTMGFGLPAAIGAALGAPHREVIAVVGDGGFQMTLQELGTILQCKMPVKIVILNNHFLGMVRQWQQLFFDRRYSFTEIESPDYILLAQSYGIDAVRVERRSDLQQSIQQMLDAEGSFLLEVKVTKEENVFPMVPSGASVSDIRLK